MTWLLVVLCALAVGYMVGDSVGYRRGWRASQRLFREQSIVRSRELVALAESVGETKLAEHFKRGLRAELEAWEQRSE